MTNVLDNIHVLHVDDEPDFGDLVREFLEREDSRFQVVTAMDAADGLEQLGESEFDCVVSDYDMPGPDGIEFLEKVRSDHPDLPFILFTGKGSEEIAGEAISAGVTDYLQKDGGTSQYRVLANRIENVVEQRAAQTLADRTEEQLQLFAEHTDDILWMYTADWEELVFINSAYEEIWGRSIEELRAYPPSFQQGVHPDDRSITRDAMNRLSDGESIDIEFRVNAKEDYGRWVWVKGDPVLDDEGEATRVTGFARDITDRKAREQRLEREQERMAFALAATDSYIFEIDFETGEERRVGDWDALHGVSEDAVPDTETFIERAVHPADQDVVRQAHAAFDPEPGATATFDYRTHPDHGDVRWIRAEIGVRQDSDGTRRGVGIATDVTDLKRERERADALFENSRDPIILTEFVDDEPTVRDVNESFEETFGYDRDDVVDNPLHAHVGPMAFDSDVERLNDRIQTGGRVLAEVQLQTDSCPSDFLLQSTPIEPGVSGQYSFITLTDITDRKRRETELARFETIVEAMGDPVYTIDSDGHFTYINDVFVEFTGYPESALLGEHVSIVMTEPDIEEGRSVIRSLLRADHARDTFEMDVILADGSAVPCENHVALLPRSGEFRGTVGVLRDISERVERERKLQSERDRHEEFARVLSHDLRNPLNVAEGQLALAAEECGSEHLASVATAHDRMEALIDEVLTLARARERVHDPVRLVLGGIIKDAWASVQSEDASLVVETEQELEADRAQFRHVLENLLRNAVEHAGPGVTVRVGDLEQGFYVEDDGPGIPPDERAEVFDAGTTTSQAGSGFGLTIVRDIVEAHSWSIEITESPEGGARFEITGVERATD